MIFVILGTQDKKFTRLLDAIQKKIDEGKISKKEKIIVQAGCTRYKSKNMQIIDYMPLREFEDYVDKSDKQHIFSVPYENQKVDETHRLVNPISNQRGVSNPYISLLGVDVSTALYDEIRLIEATNKDTFSSGGYQMNKTLFKEGSTFSLEKYKIFFQGNDNYSFNNGDSFTSTLKVEGIY